MHNKDFLDKKVLITKQDVKELGYTPITGKISINHLQFHNFALLQFSVIMQRQIFLSNKLVELKTLTNSSKK